MTLLQREDGKAAYSSPDWNRAVCLIARCEGCGGANVPAAVLTFARRKHEHGGYHDVPIEVVCGTCGTTAAVVCCESLFGDRRCPRCAPGPLIGGDTGHHILHTGEDWPGGECRSCGAHSGVTEREREDYDILYDSTRAGDFD